MILYFEHKRGYQHHITHLPRNLPLTRVPISARIRSSSDMLPYSFSKSVSSSLFLSVPCILGKMPRNHRYRQVADTCAGIKRLRREEQSSRKPPFSTSSQRVPSPLTEPTSPSGDKTYQENPSVHHPPVAAIDASALRHGSLLPTATSRNCNSKMQSNQSICIENGSTALPNIHRYSFKHC